MWTPSSRENDQVPSIKLREFKNIATLSPASAFVVKLLKKPNDSSMIE